MEISGINPYETGTLTPDPQAQGPVRLTAAGTAASGEAAEAAIQDRVNLVRTQNLASPSVEPATINEALALVQEVKSQLTVMDREEKNRLYEFDRLRELCLRLREQP